MIPKADTSFNHPCDRSRHSPEGPSNETLIPRTERCEIGQFRAAGVSHSDPALSPQKEGEAEVKQKESTTTLFSLTWTPS